MTEKHMTVAMLAEHWQCSGTFIYDRINAGDLKAFKLGAKLWRVSPNAIIEYETRQQTRRDY
ncbi:MAG: helix-turn-helix domain-containing protein [Sphingosinicella sp.]|nr:helix-turn-helix domain-containing protein [Sphingosinicella sp.]